MYTPPPLSPSTTTATPIAIQDEGLCYASIMPDPVVIGRGSYLFEHISRFLPRLRELRWDARRTCTECGYREWEGVGG